jgi:hypothetical protein
MAQVKQPFSKAQAFFEDSLKGEEAERVGFEPTRGFPLRALQARLIVHSSTSPFFSFASLSVLIDRAGRIRQAERKVKTSY